MQVYLLAKLMGTMMDAATLTAIAKDTKAISDFVLGSGLEDAVSRTGDVYMDAARLALEIASTADNKKDRINSVITHLEVAHSAYSRAWVERG